MNNKKTALVASIWSFVEKFATQAVSFIIGIFLARLLSPTDYGIVGLTTIFIALSNVFIDSGFGNAIIRKQDRCDNDYSTAFIFNILVGATCYFLLWITAPIIADYFHEAILIPLIRIIGLNVVFNSLCVVQVAILTANLNIKSQTIIALSSQIPAGIVAIVLAKQGYGVYALAVQFVLSSFIKVPLLWYCTKWHPRFVFDKLSFSYLWSFGSKLLGANLIGTFFEQIYSVLIGKYIGKTELGYYSKAQSLNQNVNSISVGVVQKVALPLLAGYQHDIALLNEKFRTFMKLLVIIIAGISALLFIVAKDLIVLLWTDKWIESVLLFRILIIGAMFGPIGQLSLSLMQATGNSGMVLKLEIPKKILYCLYLAIGFHFGIIGLVSTTVVISLTAALINMWATKKLLPYGFVSQLIDLFKYMIIAFSIALFGGFLIHSNSVLLNIILLSFCFVSCYCVVLYIIKDNVFLEYVVEPVVNFIKKR